MISITDLFTPLTSADIRARMVAELVTLNVPADKWRAGGVASTMLTVAAIVLSMMSGLISTILQGFFLPTATGNALKLLAYYVYSVVVPEATYATGNVTLTNAGGGVYTVAIGQYTALNPTSGATYSNSSAFTLNALTSLSVPMRAIAPGSAGNSTPGTITQSVTPLTGVTVTNPVSFVGSDAPTDAAIRALCTNKLASLSVRGVRTAYAYAIQVAINPVTMGPVNINRWSISEASHTGVVTLTIAAPDGTPDANDITGVVTSVEANARPMGIEVDVNGASEVDYTRTLTVYAVAAAGGTAAAVVTAIDTAISDYIAAYPIGGVTAADDTSTSFTGLLGPAIVGACATGCAAVGATLLSVRGATDLALSAGEVAADAVTVNVVLIAPTSGVLS